jgi:hypothetical protein
MNQYNETIQELINLKVISLADVLDYAYEYNMNQELNQMMAEQQWECNQGTMHDVNEDCDCTDDYDKMMIEEYFESLSKSNDNG